MATYTAYSTTADGYVESSNATYATAQAGGGTKTKNDTSTSTIRSGQRLIGGTTYYLAEPFFLFPLTAAELVGATITDALLSLYLYNDQTADYATHVQRVYEYNWGGALQTSHWRTPAQLEALTLLAAKTFTSGESAAYKAFTNNGGNLVASSQSNLGGTLYVVGASDTFVNGNAPTNVDTVLWSPAEAGDAQRAKLELTYTPAASGIPRHSDYYQARRAA